MVRRINRRRMISQSVAAAAGAATAPFVSRSTALADAAPAPSDRITAGSIGVGDQAHDLRAG
jgi:hypothetical protein